MMNGYQQYKTQTVSTMTRGELLLLLYEELLKRLTRAELALEKKDYAVFDKSVQRCRDIVLYLEETLDYQYPISHELKRFYDFFIYEFSRLTAVRKPEIIREVRPLIEDLRDAFTAADKKESGNPRLEDQFMQGMTKKG